MTDEEPRPSVANEGVLNTGPGTVNIAGSAIGRNAKVTAGGSMTTHGTPVDATSGDATSGDASHDEPAVGDSAAASVRLPARQIEAPDRHSATLVGASVVLVTAGGVFMTVTALEPTKSPHPVWGNLWFDSGFALVALGLLIGLIGVYQHFQHERQASRRAARSHSDTS
jgi:hypothetical protein